MTFFHACSGVMTVALIGLLGYILARKGWVSSSTAAVIPKFITMIVFPPYLLRSITATFERDQLLQLLYGAIIPFLSIITAFLLAIGLTRVLGVAKNRRGTFCTAFATSSALNIGIPINIALFGESSLPYVLLYFLANASFFWIVGNYSIAHDGESASVRLFSLDTLKKIFSPPLVGFFCGIILVLAGVRLPSFLDDTFKYVGSMAIGLSIIYVGIMLSDIKLRDCWHPDPDVLAVYAGRFIISPLIVIALTLVFPVPERMRNVFIVQSSLPVMMNAAILAGYYKADARYATMLASMSTLLALVTIPVTMMVIAIFLS